MKTKQTMPRLSVASGATLLAVFAFTGCGDNGNTEAGGQENGDDQGPLATAEISDTDDATVGAVEFHEQDGQLEVQVDAENLEPGFYGFHIHEIGECELDSQAPDDPEDTGDFMSSGGHLAGEDEDADHPDHAGDLPMLLVNEDGTGQMSVVTDRLNEELLLDDDGSAVIVHEDEDNYAQIPDRYLDDDDPDEDTLSTGDAGDRLGCGVVEG